MKIYKHEEFIIGENENKNMFVVARDYEFYKVDKATLEELFDKEKMQFSKVIEDNIWITGSMLCFIIITLLLYFEKCQYVLINVHFFQATLILLINIFVHEFGHILFLKLFYQESKVKVGFKFVFIYPAFYVDTSYSYLLPKYKRIAVYLAGNFANCVFVMCIMWIYPALLPYCYLTVTNLLINFLPIVKSDGYYALITLLNRTNKQLDKKKERLDDFIRGLVMFVVLSILAYC